MISFNNILVKIYVFDDENDDEDDDVFIESSKYSLMSIQFNISAESCLLPYKPTPSSKWRRTFQQECAEEDLFSAYILFPNRPFFLKTENVKIKKNIFSLSDPSSVYQEGQNVRFPKKKFQ